MRSSFKVPHMGYDPAVPSKYSVGKVINFYAIEYCIQQGYSEYDLTRGAEAYKKHLGGQPHRSLYVRLYRSRLDALVERPATVLVSALRSQAWLRRLHTRVRGG